MGLNINTNIASLIAQHNLNLNNISLNKTTEQLASGNKINHSSDDAAGLSISEKMRSQIRGVDRAKENSQDGINLLQIVEGSLSVVLENLQRIRELTVQAANDSNSSVERAAIKQEVLLRIEDITQIKQTTSFNQIDLLDGSVSQYLIRTGPNADNATNTLDISGALGNLLMTFLANETTAGALSTAFLDGTGARQFLNSLDAAVRETIGQRSKLGALQSRLEGITENLSIYQENLIGAESRIRNIDVSQATSELARKQILMQASVSVLSQANRTPELAAKLLSQIG